MHKFYSYRPHCNSTATTEWMAKFRVELLLPLLSTLHKVVHTDILSQRLLLTNDAHLLGSAESERERLSNQVLYYLY